MFNNKNKRFSIVASLAVLIILTAGAIAILSGCGLSQVPKKNKLKSNLYYRLGVGFYQNGNFIKAMQEFIRAKSLNPNSAKNFNAIGMVYMETDREGKAINNFKKAVNINPRFSDAYYNLAIIYIKEKNYTLAKSYLKDALKNPFYNRPYESYTELAKIYIMEKNWKKAKKILTISELLDKNYFLTYFEFGKYYLIRGKLNRSLYNFKKALKNNMFFVPAKYYEGVIFFKQKRYNKAKNIFSSIYENNKTNVYGTKSLEYIKKIMMH